MEITQTIRLLEAAQDHMADATNDDTPSIMAHYNDGVIYGLEVAIDIILGRAPSDD